MPTSTQRLDDGFSTIISFENLPSVRLYEKEITPPGYQGGGATDTTTMRNTTWRTSSPKSLKTLGTVTAVCAFATEVLPQVLAQVNVNQLITITFPDDSTLAFYGWIDSFVPDKFTEGEQPTATVTIQPSNHDNTDTESAPTYTQNSSDL